MHHARWYRLGLLISTAWGSLHTGHRYTVPCARIRR